MADTVANCHETPGQPASPGARRVALVGSPNSGKSTLFNALTGAGRAVGNYPGTSVEVGTGRWVGPRLRRARPDRPARAPTRWTRCPPTRP